jgi:hypothetical protein
MSTEPFVSLSALAAMVAAFAGTWAIVNIYKRHRQLPLPPGPPEKSWWAGNAEDIPQKFTWVKFTEWAKKYGK